MSAAAVSMGRATGVMEVQAGSAANTPGSAEGAGSLLPSPAEVGGDAMLGMYALMSADRQAGKVSAFARAATSQRERKAAIAEELRRLQEAAKARDSGGFWGGLKKACSTLAKAGLVVAAVGSTVASGGLTGPLAAVAIAGVALSAGAFLQGETKILQELGVSDKVAGWIETGMSLGASACMVVTTCGAGAASGAGTDALGKSAAGKLTGSAAAKGASAAARAASNAAGALGNGVGGGARVAGATAAVRQGAVAASVVQVTARLAASVGGAGTMAGGVCAIQESRYEARATELTADAESAHLASERLARMLQRLLDDLESDEGSAERAMGSLKEAIGIRGNSLTAASAVRV